MEDEQKTHTQCLLLYVYIIEATATDITLEDTNSQKETTYMSLETQVFVKKSKEPLTWHLNKHMSFRNYNRNSRGIGSSQLERAAAQPKMM